MLALTITIYFLMMEAFLLIQLSGMTLVNIKSLFPVPTLTIVMPVTIVSVAPKHVSRSVALFFSL